MFFVSKVPEDPKEEKKPEFVNFKRTVWHESLHVVLQSLIRHSTLGCWLQCGDGDQRWLFPNILILSADYEEQCVFLFFLGEHLQQLTSHYQVCYVTYPWTQVETPMSSLSR
jgi:hypothetical protein